MRKLILAALAAFTLASAQYIPAGGSGNVTGLCLPKTQQVLSMAAASITFSGISGTCSTLKIELMGRDDTAAANVNVFMQVNGDTGTNYHSEFLLGNNASPSSGNTNATANPTICFIAAANAPASAPGHCEITIFNYAATTFFKIGYAIGGVRNAATTNNNLATWWQWAGTPAAVTSVVLTPSAGNFIAGTIATIYGLI